MKGVQLMWRMRVPGLGTQLTWQCNTQQMWSVPKMLIETALLVWLFAKMKTWRALNAVQMQEIEAAPA